jgi:hypothetical protein
LKTRGRRAAEKKKADEQQRNRASHSCGDDDDRPHRRDEVAGRETRPTSMAIHDGRRRQRKQGSADYYGALRDA